MMKKIILLISLSLVFSQELKVEGNLRVNGVVLNTKVDSLEFVIDSLQTQVDSLKILHTEQQTLIEELQAQIMQLGSLLGLVDCAEQIGGDAVEDVCGVCDNDSSNDGIFDNCGICDSDVSNDCLLDCNGEWGGGAELDVCGVCEGDALSVDGCACIDFDGNGYNSIIIGNQEWMSGNLKVTHYNNGDAISNITNNGDWSSLSTGAYGDYDNNPSNSEIYGRLYNWYTVDDSRGVCPEGWHIPTDNEFTVLTDYLGGTSVSRWKDEKSRLRALE
jgi:hypothetical protein